MSSMVDQFFSYFSYVINDLRLSPDRWLGLVARPAPGAFFPHRRRHGSRLFAAGATRVWRHPGCGRSGPLSSPDTVDDVVEEMIVLAGGR